MDFVLDLEISDHDSFYRPSSSSSDHFSSYFNDERTFSFAQEKGSRRKMQDKLNITKSEDGIVFSVFDGHGSQKVANFLEENLPKKLLEASKHSDETVKQCKTPSYLVFNELDSCISKSKFKNDGSTSLSVILNQKFAKVCNLGDSRAIIVSKNSNYFQITEDHSTYREDEVERIQKQGGWVLPVGKVLRVQGSLAVTRSFGDFNLKPFILSEPEIYNFDIKDDQKYLVIATDGLWNVKFQFNSGNDKSRSSKILEQLRWKESSPSLN